jgi:transcriptional regulator with XRE-family HTH domain
MSRAISEVVEKVPWDPETSHRFGRKLQFLRTERGLTQEQLANLSRLTRNHLQLIEAGIGSTRDRSLPSNPRMSTVFRLAEALGVDAADLLGGSGASSHPRRQGRTS